MAEIKDDFFVSTPQTTQIFSTFLHSDKVIAIPTVNRRARCIFGAEPKMCARIWLCLKALVPQQTKPKHLLWGLIFLKFYEPEISLAVRVGADEKMSRNGEK